MSKRPCSERAERRKRLKAETDELRDRETAELRNCRSPKQANAQEGRAKRRAVAYILAMTLPAGPSVAIRRAVPDDATAIAEVHVASWRTTYPGIVDQAYIDSLSVPERAEAWGRRLSADPDMFPDVLVAEAVDGGIVGFISGGAIRDSYAGFDAELYAIYLLDSAQQKGVGRRLLREWAGLALASGWHAAVVRVLAGNPACSFYERLGAERLRDTQYKIAGKLYPERWYGWRNLYDLRA